MRPAAAPPAAALVPDQYGGRGEAEARGPEGDPRGEALGGAGAVPADQGGAHGRGEQGVGRRSDGHDEPAVVQLHVRGGGPATSRSRC